MELAIFGATGAVGRQLVEQAVAEGHDVRAVVRDVARLTTASPRLTLVQGELEEAERLASALAGADAVLSALGPAANSAQAADRLVQAVRAIVDAMEEHGVRRYVGLSGGAVRLDGERKQVVDALASAVVRVVARHVVDAKQRECELLRDSGLDWVIVRPPRITDGPLTGSYRAGEIRIGPRSRISRADVAHFMLRQVSEDRYLRRGPFISY